MTREAKAPRRESQPDGEGWQSTGRPQPGWFLHESPAARQHPGVFQPQLDARTVRDYWRSRAQNFSEPPDIDPWDEEEAPHVARPPRTSQPDDDDAARGEDETEAHEFPARRGGGAFAAMVLAAGCIGVIGGAVALDQVRGGEIAASAVAWAQSVWRDASPLAIATTVAEPAVSGGDTAKPIFTATLDVADVQGEANALIPLSLRAEAGVPGREIALKIEGLPEDARLTAGTRIGGTWLLRMEEIADVQLMMPTVPEGPLALSVSAIEPETGALASPIKGFSILVTPASAKLEAATNVAATRRNVGSWGAP